MNNVNLLGDGSFPLPPVRKDRPLGLGIIFYCGINTALICNPCATGVRYRSVPRAGVVFMSSFVPPYIFSKEWQRDDFQIPADPKDRAALWQEFYYYLHYAVMWRPENEHAREVLAARLAKIEEHDKILSAAKSEEWARANKAEPHISRRQHLDLSHVSIFAEDK